jgi:chromosome segregation ATPase
MDGKKQFTLRLSPALADMIAEFKELYEENTGEVLNTDKKIFEAILDTAQSKYAPFKDNSKKTAELQAENKKLKQQLDTLSAGKSKLDETTAELQNEIRRLQAENEEIKDKVAKVLIYNTDINIVINKLIELYLKDKKTQSFFKKLNANGKYNGFFDVPDKEKTQENIRKLLLSAFLASAMGKPLPAVVSNAKIKTKIDAIISKTDF